MGCQTSKPGAVGEPSSLTEDQKLNVRESWEWFTTDDNFGDNSCLIFVKLFELAPASKELFSFVGEVSEEALTGNEALHKHAGRVTDAIGLVVGNMEELDKVAKVVRALGGRHAGYGVKEEYIQPVAQGVMYALERSLKDRFSSEHEKAWVTVLGLVGQLFAKGLNEKGGK